MPIERRRTLYPAIRLWRAEVKALVRGQDPNDPKTWVRDELFEAVWYEVEAHALTEIGALEEARVELHRARAVFLQRDRANPAWQGNRSNVRDSDYRIALFTRALRHLGSARAADLCLKERPRNGRHR